LHTISWNVFDNHGRGDGIGSRYFNVFNNGGVAVPEQTALAPMPAQAAIFRGRENRNAQRLEPDGNGVLKVDVQELEWIEVDLGASDGCLLVSGEKRALPVGSTLKEGVFYWQVGPGFLGNYEFVFERPHLLDLKLRVTIESKQFR
jgi:hypothetical protein